MKKRLSRREFLVLAGVAGGSSILAACTSSAPAEAPAAQEPAAEAPAAEAPAAEAPAAEAVTITFSGWGATEEDEGVQAAIKVFEEETPNIKVDWLHIPDNYQDKVLSMAAAGTPPDTGFVGSGDFRTYTRDGLLLDITDNIKADPVVGATDYLLNHKKPNVVPTTDAGTVSVLAGWPLTSITTPTFLRKQALNHPVTTRQKPGIGTHCYR